MDYLRVCADTGVKPCSITDKPVAYLNQGIGLETIVNNAEMKTYRKTLLSGELLPTCLNCTNRGWIEVEKPYL
ncbi:hypothetical protein ACFL2Q_19005 [Thermodesulfobacteriota bacterium]